MAESHSNTPWKKIPLTQGQVAIVDADDYEFLMQWKWQAMRRKDRRNAPWYAVRTVRKAGQKNSLLQMASLIMKSSAKIDHANRNSLDNRKSNLRECTASQNAANRPVQSNNTSGHPGVSWDRKLKKWRAYITKDQVRIGLGFFVDLHSAILTRRAAARKLFGVFSNEP